MQRNPSGVVNGRASVTLSLFLFLASLPLPQITTITIFTVRSSKRQPTRSSLASLSLSRLHKSVRIPEAEKALPNTSILLAYLLFRCWCASTSMICAKLMPPRYRCSSALESSSSAGSPLELLITDARSSRSATSPVIKPSTSSQQLSIGPHVEILAKRSTRCGVQQ